MDMIREFMLWVSETLFYVLNGVALANTPWFFVWVFFWALVMVSPMIHINHYRTTKWSIPLFLICFFPGLFLAVGPPIIQMQMIQECEIVELEETLVNLNGEIVDLGPLSVNRCRVKDNYYGDFGEWNTMGGAR